MTRTTSNRLAIEAGTVLMLVALGCSLITTTGDYRGVLTTAAACGAVAAGCFAVPLWRGPLVWRVAALVLGSPLLFVLSELVRRGPYVFGR